MISKKANIDQQNLSEKAKAFLEKEFLKCEIF